MDDAIADGKPATRWLLLIHQLPAKPAYARVKIWRRLAEIGAVPVKNAVHALPASEQAQEDFEWLLRETIASGGEALICEARLVDGLNDEEVQALFDAAREADYDALGREIRAVLDQRGGQSAPADEDLGAMRAQLKRWRKRLADIVSLDFFGANGRETAEAALAEIAARLLEQDPAAATPPETADRIGRLQHRVWVTRRNVHVDRIASAWLIGRFIDPQAEFRFVAGQGYRPAPGELRFDMFEAEFTHEGDRCTFEVLLARTGLSGPALTAIAEIVHDLDLKDAKFGRDEAAGIACLIGGLAAASRDDDERLARGAVLFDDLYEYFYRRRG